ncbi:MAG: hypothetical protein U5L11_11735 [Arhodomonas sp.]|nr:hypothetical protein [Arhodomonas sp.]
MEIATIAAYGLNGLAVFLAIPAAIQHYVGGILSRLYVPYLVALLIGSLAALVLHRPPVGCR